MRKKVCNRCGKIAGANHICNTPGRVIGGKKTVNQETAKITNSSRWQNKRDFIKSRDGHYCQRCFYKFNEITRENLEVHHIKPLSEHPELAFDDNNLITICHSCNMQLGVSGKLDFEYEIQEYVPMI